MSTGKAVPKLVPSFARRRLRLGVSHHGVATRWSAGKEVGAEPTRPPAKKKR